MARATHAFALAVFLLGAPAGAQRPDAASTTPSISPEAKPLPDIAVLMQEVERRQGAFEAIQRDYIYHEHVVSADTDSSGRMKKVETRDYEDFTVDGVSIRRLLAKDDVPRSDRDKQKESERIDKQIAKAKEQRAKGQGDPHTYTISAQRFLELGSFSNPRREQRNGRDTIVVDYTGDPKAKTRNPLEGIVHDLSGTVWIDEADRTLVQAEGRFAHSFKIGGGLIASVHEGTHFRAEWAKINDEVWLPSHIHGEGEARILLLISNSGILDLNFSDYRKFKTSSTFLPATETSEPKPVHAAPNGQPGPDTTPHPPPQPRVR
jgi:hypothetical protein